MNENEKLINHFYSSFQRKDIAAMQTCYADDATFNDAIFSNLTADEVKAMWAMLIKKGRDMTLTFDGIQANSTSGSVRWIATYTFSLTGNKVVNVIDAKFTFKNGKILTHTDSFSFYRWASQALGITGKLLGWTPLVKNKIRKTAASNLDIYIAAKAQTL